MGALLAWIAWVLLSFCAALTGTVWPPGDWYEALAKPEWTPPGWVFPVVWTTLYVLMGTAAWIVQRRARVRGGAGRALSLFLLQLALNAAWTPTFFGAHQVFWALVIIVALWITLLATALAFRPVSLAAGLLLVPYLAWVSIATVLNYQIWRLNT